jgi:radical SAM protein with 4Fe4S-binding SPASM domain
MKNQTDRIPIWLWIDPTRRCNLACSLCYTRQGQGPEDLLPAVLDTILDNVVDENRVRVQQVTFNWRGEPTLNRHLSDLLIILSKRMANVATELHTNATTLTSRNSDKIVAAAGNNLTICISLDGGNEASHDAQRGRGTFRRSLAGGWALLRARGTQTKPRIILHQLNLCVSENDYDEEFVRFANSVDGWQIKYPIIPGGERRLFANAAYAPAGTELIKDWPKARLDWETPTGACFWAGNSLCIAPNGDVYVCLLSTSKLGVLGNLASEKVWSILERARTWRKHLEESGRSYYQHCTACRMEEGEVKALGGSGQALDGRGYRR